MDTIDDYMRQNSEQYEKRCKITQQELELRREQERQSRRQRVDEWQHSVVDSVRMLREEIGNRHHLMYMGERIRLFGYDFVTQPLEWTIHAKDERWHDTRGGGGGCITTFYKFRGRETAAIRPINGGHYFPEWNISVHNVLIRDIEDYKILDIGYNDVGMPAKISICYLSSTGTFKILFDKLPFLHSSINKYKLRKALRPLKEISY